MTQEKLLKVVNDLIDVNDYIWGKNNYDSRPNGSDFIQLVLEIADHIAWRTDIKLEDLTDEVQEMLENENYHTLNHAIDTVKHLSKYA